MIARGCLALTGTLLLGATLCAPARAAAAAPRPVGLYVLDNAANLNPTSQMYPAGLFTDTTYLRHVAGHAIFCPLAKILPASGTWGNFQYEWSVLDTLVGLAVSHGKKFSIELETGFQTSSGTWQQALPGWFTAACDSSCAPLFDVWAVGAGGACTSSYVLLPWAPGAQQFWSVTAESLATHLRNIGAYGSLTLVHVPGLSVYDEELRLPTGSPSPGPTDTLPCADGRTPQTAVASDARQSRWQRFGYSDAAVIAGFQSITTAFANAFPDRVLGLSLFPHGSGAGIAFPNFTSDSAGYVASRLVQVAGQVARGRLQVQSDNLDSATIVPSVISLARENEACVGWQSNKHGGTGAGCGGGAAGSCLPDAPDGHFYNLLAYGASLDAHYFEIWPRDVTTYPRAIAAADAAGLYSTLAVPPPAHAPPWLRLAPNAPNPFTSRTTIGFTLGHAARVRLAIYDLGGRQVSVLVDGREGTGSHAVRYDALGLASGVYEYRLVADGVATSRSFVVVR